MSWTALLVTCRVRGERNRKPEHSDFNEERSVGWTRREAELKVKRARCLKNINDMFPASALGICSSCKSASVTIQVTQSQEGGRQSSVSTETAAVNITIRRREDFITLYSTNSMARNQCSLI